LTSKEAQRYYRISDNIGLDKLEAKLNNMIEPKVTIDKYKDAVTRVISKGLKRGWFIEGNGEKILRRLINYARNFRIPVDTQSFSLILYN
jgi:hypothetical protein